MQLKPPPLTPSHMIHSRRDTRIFSQQKFPFKFGPQSLGDKWKLNDMTASMLSIFFSFRLIIQCVLFLKFSLLFFQKVLYKKDWVYCYQGPRIFSMKSLLRVQKKSGNNLTLKMIPDSKLWRIYSWWSRLLTAECHMGGLFLLLLLYVLSNSAGQ